MGDSVLAYAPAERDARSSGRAVVLAIAAFLAEAGAFVHIALGYDGPLQMNWLLFHGLIVLGFALSACGIALGIRVLGQRGRVRLRVVFVLAVNGIMAFLAAGYFGMMLVFQIF